MSQTPSECVSPFEVLNADGITWDPISSDSALSIDYTTGELTIQSTSIGTTTQLRIESTQFSLHRCKYTYVQDSTTPVPNIPVWIDEITG